MGCTWKTKIVVGLKRPFFFGKMVETLTQKNIFSLGRIIVDSLPYSTY